MRLGRSGCRRIARGEVFVDLLSDCPELTLLELGDPDPAPAFGGANERGIHQLQYSTLAKGVRDDFGAELQGMRKSESNISRHFCRGVSTAPVPHAAGCRPKHPGNA